MASRDNLPSPPGSVTLLDRRARSGPSNISVKFFMSEPTPQTPAVRPGDQILERRQVPTPRLGFEHLPSPGGLVAGGLAGLYALKRRDMVGLFAAGVSLGLLYRSARHNGLLDGGWLRRLFHTRNRQFVPFERQLIVDQPPEFVYEFWRNSENLAVYLPRVRDVKQLQQNLTRWQLKLTDTLRVEWTAELLEEVPEELLVWRTRNPSDLYHEGWVEFEPLREGRSTRVTIRVYLLAPGGGAGAKLVEQLRDSSRRFFTEELQRAREVLESELADS